jgi:hypothetical protein
MSKKILIISILLIGLFVIGVASASDNSTCDTADLKLNDDVIDINQSQIDDNSDNDEVINAGDNGKFAELENKITSASEDTITLDKDYEYENTFKSNAITISKSLTIDGQGHTINCNDYHGCLFYSIKVMSH